VYDVRGRRVAVLARGNVGAVVGVIRLTWAGGVDGGGRAAPGIYFVRARAPSLHFDLERKIILLR
jgi:hypothetical protein